MSDGERALGCVISYVYLFLCITQNVDIVNLDLILNYYWEFIYFSFDLIVPIKLTNTILYYFVHCL